MCMQACIYIYAHAHTRNHTYIHTRTNCLEVKELRQHAAIGVFVVRLAEYVVL